MPEEVTVESAINKIIVSPSTQTVDVETSTQVLVIKPDGKAISVTKAGPAGPPGLDGAPGPKGDPGDASEFPTSMTVESPGAVSVWHIPHPYNRNPSVEIRDSTDRVCHTPVSYSAGFVHIDISPSNITLKAKLTP
jgi:hypothetical protein